MSSAFLESWLFASIIMFCLICGVLCQEGWTVPMEPQAGLLNLNSTEKAKYMKEIIWIDDDQSVEDEDVSVNPSVSDLRTSLSNTLMSALAKNELVDGVREPWVTSQQYEGSSESYPTTSTSTITLSRDLIPILLQRSARYGSNDPPPLRVEGMSGPQSTASPLFLEDLVKEKQREQSESHMPELMSYASASSTQSYQESRPSFAFDGNPNTLWVSRPWKAGENSKPQWIEYSFEEPQIIGEYSLASYPSLDMNMARSKSTLSLASLGEAVFGGPTGWTLSCSKDGVEWVDLHHVKLSQPWVPGEKRSFSVLEHSWWNYCRVYIHAVPKRSDGTMQAALSEVTFLAPPSQEAIPSEHQVQYGQAQDNYHINGGGYGAMRTRDHEGETVPSESQGVQQEWWRTENKAYGITRRNFVGFDDSVSSEYVHYESTTEESRDGITPRSALPLNTEEFAVVHQAAEQCVFPFMHNNILQYNCIPFQDAQWCKSRENDWLVCDNSNEKIVGQTMLRGGGGGLSVPAKSQSYLDSSNKRSLSVPLPATQEYMVARQCKFPFLHFGSLHDECVSFQDEYWCKDQQERWLHCKDGDRKIAADNSEERGAANPGNKDWYLSLASNENTVDDIQSLNVIEMKPKSSSDESEIEYEVCKTSGSSDFELYIPPRYTRLPLGDDQAANVKLPEGFSFPFYGRNYENIYVGSNGYITFDVADTNYLPSEESHLQKKRISVFFADVDPSDGGEVQFADLNTAVAITWKNVTIDDPSHHDQEHISPQQTTFQTILFEDGTIWMGFQEVQTNSSSIIGLSSGSQGLASVEAVRSLASIQEC